MQPTNLLIIIIIIIIVVVVVVVVVVIIIIIIIIIIIMNDSEISFLTYSRSFYVVTSKATLLVNLFWESLFISHAVYFQHYCIVRNF